MIKDKLKHITDLVVHTFFRKSMLLMDNLGVQGNSSFTAILGNTVTSMAAVKALV